MRRPFTIRTRLTLWYGAALGITVAALGVLVWVSTAAVLRGSVDEALRVQAADVRAGIARAATVAVTRLDPAQPGIFTAIFGRRGAVEVRSPGVPAGLRPPPAGTSVTQEQFAEGSYAVLAIPAPDGATVVVGSSLSAVDRELDSLGLLLVAIGLAGFGASLVGGWLLSGRALAPVERLTSEATVIGAADLERRLPEPARLDEIGRLSRTLNGMLDRLAASVRREREFIAAASHDLRTPISALRTELELAARNPDDGPAMLTAVRVAHADAVRLSTLAADLLGLAEAEANGRALVRRPVVVDELVAAAIAAVQPLATERATTLSISATDAVVDVDRVRVEQTLVNLLSNAIREAPAGSSVDVAARVTPASGGSGESGSSGSNGSNGGTARRRGSTSRADRLPAVLDIAVLDRGPGVAPSVRPVLFVPFASRARGRSDGTGLGLATAAAAVQAHGGEIGYEERPGGGATFRFRIPTTMLVRDPPQTKAPRPDRSPCSVKRISGGHKAGDGRPPS
ncbi:MAG TPA: ATP-binding protein [Verrucomicrobiae bacterium]|nr:ATP-binding protein [Verrucomicrobiae bacterium]